MLKTSLIIENLEDLAGFRANVAMLREAGFEAADAALFTPRLEELIQSGEWRPLAREVRTITEEAGLALYQCHTSLPLEPAEWPPLIPLIEKQLVFAGAIGAKNAVVHPICPLTVNDPLLQEGDAAAMEANLKMYRRLLPVAADAGVTICTENLFSDGRNMEVVPCFSSHAAELNELMEQLPGLKICLDIGHAAAAKQDPAEMVYSFGERLAALHLHGNDLVHDLHVSPFGSADMGWDRFCKALRDVGYQGSINLEVMYLVRNTPRELLPATYRYLHACAAYLAEKASI